MKYIVLTMAGIMWSVISSVACTVCKSQQPKLLQGITHGTGPDSNWDYVIVAASVVFVLIITLFSVRLLIKPGEANHDHIKRTILNTNV